MKYLFKRKGRYYFSRRVPDLVKDYDPRILIRISLKTDSRRQAERKLILLNDQIEAYWDGLIKSGQRYEDRHFRKAIGLAQAMGFGYVPVAALASFPIEQIVSRILATKTGTPEVTDAVLGGKPEPEVKLSEALEKFWCFAQDRTMNKTDHQLRKWKNPRRKAVKSFIAVVGDKNLKSITREDIMQFKEWWIKRIKHENKNAGSANKDFIYLKSILDKVSDNLQLKLDTTALFKKAAFETRFTQTRLPFTTEQILHILNSDRLENLNQEARNVLLIAAETGARPTEICGLLPEDIRLEAEIPHFRIIDRKERPLKTAHSERSIPILGYTLKAFREMPNGFPKYRDKPDHLTNVVNKFLRENELVPSPKHTMYSLRHSFQDRILQVNVPDRVQAELMGHKFQRPKYGDGATLALKKEWLQKVCLK